MSLRQEIEYSPAHVSHIKKTVFRIASPERILQNSVAEIYNHLATPYDKQDGHLFDKKMGPKDRGGQNSLSKLEMKWDPGHFGHIKLAKPVFQIPYYTMIVQILNMVCHRCSSLLVSPMDEKTMKQLRARKGKARFAYLQQHFKKDPKICWNCAACTIKCVKDTKDGSPKIAIKQGGVRNRGGKWDGVNTILVNPTVCKTAAAKSAGKPGQGDDEETEGGLAEVQVSESSFPKSEREIFDFIDAEVAHTILKKITDNDCELMGLSPESARPDWMIWTIMPVPPPSMRPAVTNESGQTADDDLTHKLNDIIKTNNQIRNLLSTDQTEGDRKHLYNWWQLLQYHVATYIDNDIRSNIPPAINRSGRAYKTLRQRINHKEGRIRGNLMGKRADKTARSVITPDPNISIDELGVPYDIAQTLTRDEIVNVHNIKRLTQLVRNGPVWPGANSYESKTESTFEAGSGISAGSVITGLRKSFLHGNLAKAEYRAKIVLKYGDIVHRHLLDGDVVLFNRQPSLHKMSMMGHRAKILPGKTFRLNPQVCTPYNADFDGDEMNMHIPNSLQTAAEVREIALVPHQIVSPQASRPIMGLIQDALLASYRFTKVRPEPHLNTMQVMTLLGVTSGYAGRLPMPNKEGENRKMLWDTKRIISTFLPKVNYKVDRSDGKEKELPKDPTEASQVLDIENGLMKSGYFDKDTFGSKANSLIHVTWNDWGTEATRNLFDDMNKMAMQWLIMDGFSVGIGDMSIAKPDYDEIQQQIHEKVLEAQTKIEFLHQGRYPIVGGDDKKDFHKIMVEKLGYWIPNDSIYFSDTGKPTMEQFEADMYVVLNNARKAAEENTSKKISEKAQPHREPSHRDVREHGGRLDQARADRHDAAKGEGAPSKENRMASMINSGSKGSKTNTVQITVLLGQQDMDGGRIPNGYQRRPLPHFNKDTLVPEAHGFIDNGYLRGLDPTQYFFHAMSGRVGVISTSIKTAETGYLQRRLMKALEDMGVRYDWTVRNANDLVFQFYYGLDGFDGSKLEVQKLDYVSLSDDDFRLKYQFQPNELNNASEMFSANVLNEMSLSKGPEVLQDPLAKWGPNAGVELDPSVIAALDLEFYTLSMDRDLLRKSFFKDPTRLPDKFYIPVNFTRLIESYKSRFNIRNRKLADLDPRYVVLNVDRLIQTIVGEYQIPATYVNGVPTKSPEDLLIIKALIRSYLATKKLVKMGFTKEAFDFLIQDINRKFEEAYVNPGEMVGAIAAQSIGEPSTQMTLNSVDYATSLAIVWTSKSAPPAPVDGPVGTLIDALMLERAAEVQVQPDGVTEYLPLEKGEAMALSCDKNGNIRWTPLEAVTRHPVVNADGSNTLVRVKLESGRCVDVTRAKSMLVHRNGIIEACDGETLKVGDEVPVVWRSRKTSGPANEDSMDRMDRLTTIDLRTFIKLPKTYSGLTVIELTRSFGSSIGTYLMKGHTTDLQMQQIMEAMCGSFPNKRVPSFALCAPDDFIDGLLDGYVSEGTIASKSKSVRDGIATLLQIRFGTQTILTEELSKDSKEDIFYNFSMSNTDVKDCLGEHILDKIVALEAVEPTGPNKRVYDLTVAETRNMTTMSGIALADTFHLAGVGEKANVSRGVPRIREILRVTNVLATPTVTVAIKREALLRPRPRINDNDVDCMNASMRYVDPKTKEPMLPAATWETIRDKKINEAVEGETTYDRARKLAEEDEKKIAHMNADDLASRIEYTTFRDLISSVTIVYDPNKEVEKKKLSADDFVESYNEYMKGIEETVSSDDFPWMIRIEFKKSVCSQKHITIEDIKLALAKLQTMGSPDQTLQFSATDDNYVYIDNSGDPAYIMRIKANGSTTVGPANARRSIADSPINLIRYLEKTLLNIRVKGIPGIETARVRFIKDYPYYDPIDGSIKKTFNYEIDTNGVNMLDIWNMKDIDPEKTYSNHIIEIYETLGISAVREAIVNELNEVFLYAGAGINPRHVELLADMMTSRGYLISVDRHGMSKGDSGPWARASFEETTAQIFKAATYGEVDPMTGVSANIMTGQFIPAGTNSFRMALDETIIETMKPYKPASVTDKAKRALERSLKPGVGSEDHLEECSKETTMADFCAREPGESFKYDFL